MKRRIRSGDIAFHEEQHGERSADLVSFTIDEDATAYWGLNPDDADFNEVALSRDGVVTIEGVWPVALLVAILRRAARWSVYDGRPLKAGKR